MAPTPLTHTAVLSHGNQPPPDSDSIHVHVRRNPDTAQWEITPNEASNVELDAVITHLPKKYHTILRRFRFRGGYYTTLSTINRVQGISPQEWADAIGAALMASRGEGEAITPASTSYLAFGERIYKLSPVAMTSQTKALALLRKKASDKANEVANQIIATAKNEATEITNSANSTANSMLSEAQRIKAEAERQSRRANAAPPEWTNGSPVEFKDEQWFVRGTITVEIHELQTSTRKFILPHLKRSSANLWIPVGAAKMSAIHADLPVDVLPHICMGSSCFALSTKFDNINGRKALNDLLILISQNVRIAKMDNLLSSPAYWIQHLDTTDIPSLEVLRNEDYNTWMRTNGTPRREAESWTIQDSNS